MAATVLATVWCTVLPASAQQPNEEQAGEEQADEVEPAADQQPDTGDTKTGNLADDQTGENAVEKKIEIDYEKLGNELFWQARYDEAMAAFEAAIKKRPKNPQNRYMAGLSLNKLGKHKAAIEYFEKAISLYREKKIEHDQGILNCYLNIARAYNDLENYGKVEEIARVVMEQYPHNTDIYNILGGSYMNREDYNRAISILNEALKISPPNGYTYNNLGMCYLKQGNVEAANTYFKRAVELVPYSAAFIYNNLALTYEMMGNTNAALEAYRKALSIDPANQKSLQSIARLTGQ